MLVFTRRRNEAVVIGDGIEVRVLRVGRDGVPLTTPETQWRIYGEWRLLD